MPSPPKNPLTTRRWIWHSFAGWFAGLILLLVFADFSSQYHFEFFWIGTSMAVGIGLTQWLALRNRAGITINWMWFTILGMGSVYLIFNLLYLYIQPLAALFEKVDSESGMGIIVPLASPLGGLLTGWLHYKFILLKIYPDSKRWMGASCLSWGLCSTALILYLVIAGNLHFHHYASGKLLNLVMVLGGGFVMGWITSRPIISIVNGK